MALCDESILFDVPPRLAASAFSINAKRSVLDRHPMEHFTSLSKMACMSQERHVSHSKRALQRAITTTRPIRNLPFFLSFARSMLHRPLNIFPIRATNFLQLRYLLMPASLPSRSDRRYVSKRTSCEQYFHSGTFHCTTKSIQASNH